MQHTILFGLIDWNQKNHTTLGVAATLMTNVEYNKGFCCNCLNMDTNMMEKYRSPRVVIWMADFIVLCWNMDQQYLEKHRS